MLHQPSSIVKQPPWSVWFKCVVHILCDATIHEVRCTATDALGMYTDALDHIMCIDPKYPTTTATTVMTLEYLLGQQQVTVQLTVC